MTKMTEPDLRSLDDAELAALSAAALAELAARDRRRKDDAITRIRALAGEAGLTVSIAGARGRPAGTNRKGKQPAKADAAKAKSSA